MNEYFERSLKEYQNYLEEYRVEKAKNKEEQWLKIILAQYLELKLRYEEISSNLAPESAEVIGEIRERKYIVKWLKEMKESTETLSSETFGYAALAIEKGEHI
jgi:hypothetical protein